MSMVGYFRTGIGYKVETFRETLYICKTNSEDFLHAVGKRAYQQYLKNC